MPQIDLTIPKNAFDNETKSQLLPRLTEVLLRWEGVPPTSPVVPWVWGFIHEVEEGAWSYGGRVAGGGDQPRYRVVITVPEGALDAQHKEGLIAEVTSVISEAEPDAKTGGLPQVTCFVLDVQDGGYGVAGRVHHSPKVKPQ